MSRQSQEKSSASFGMAQATAPVVVVAPSCFAEAIQSAKFQDEEELAAHCLRYFFFGHKKNVKRFES